MLATPGHKIGVLDHGFVQYVMHMGTDRDIVRAARVSYLSADRSAEEDQKLLYYLWRNKHTSPFEMAKIVFNMKMPIFCARQYIRHRMQNYNEQSARYGELASEFYIPSEWRAQDTKNKQSSKTGAYDPATNQYFSETLEAQCVEAFETYQELLANGVAREMARMVLPLNIYTEFRCCWDLKNLLHFITLRDDPHAQWEIQQYGIAIKTFLRQLFPWTMEAYDKFKFPCQEVS
jgi:thymidylate synthase (FAD)